MRYRKLGNTDILISEIGFGAWGIGGWAPGQLSYGPVSESTAVDALEEAFDKGITFYDTSPLYGEGKSEQLIGKVFKSKRDKIIIASKAGLTNFDAKPDFSPKAISNSVEKSLDRLKTDYIDVLQLHSPPIEVLRQRDDIRDCLDRLADEGKIRTYGVSVQAPEDGLEAARDLGYQLVQVNFNMLDLRVLECGLMALAEERGIALIARTPLCFGFLSGLIEEDTIFPEHDHRQRWNGEQIGRWVRGANAVLAAARSEETVKIRAALRFCLSYSGVSTVIPGILNAGEVEANVGTTDLGRLSDAVLANIEKINRETNFFGR